MVYGIVLTTLMDIDCRRSELSWSREAQQATVENYNNFHRIDIWGFPKMVGNPPKRNGYSYYYQWEKPWFGVPIC